MRQKQRLHLTSWLTCRIPIQHTNIKLQSIIIDTVEILGCSNERNVYKTAVKNTEGLARCQHASVASVA